MNRGTKKSPKTDPTAISGEDFKEEQDKKLDESGVEFISSGRGTSKIPVDKTKTPKKKKFTGKIHTGRGTNTQ